MVAGGRMDSGGHWQIYVARAIRRGGVHSRRGHAPATERRGKGGGWQTEQFPLRESEETADFFQLVTIWQGGASGHGQKLGNPKGHLAGGGAALEAHGFQPGVDALPHRCGIWLRQRPQQGFARQTEGVGQPQKVRSRRKVAAGGIGLNLMEVRPVL